jgi:protein-tyrosine phosphatase
VLVHCSQGVSRSAALTIGYLMWKLGRPYQEVADLVKAIRGVTNPNIGFACQVWRKSGTAWHPTNRQLHTLCLVLEH